MSKVKQNFTVIVSGDTWDQREALKMRKFHFVARGKFYRRKKVDKTLAGLLQKRFELPGLKVEVK